MPVVAGLFPYSVYLQKGKVYFYCTCGISPQGPFCDFSCNKVPTRNRPIYFNVNESSYYKLCNCKFSPNAPFCNGTHTELVKFYNKSHRGFYEIVGVAVYSLGWLYILWNFFT